MSIDKGGFFQLYPFLTERVIYLRYDIALRAMIYASRMKERILYHIFTECKYIIRQRRISYRAGDISLKNVRVYDIIVAKKKGFDMFKWIVNLFKPTPDKIEERLLSLFDFMLNTYDFSYYKEEFGDAVDKNGKDIMKKFITLNIHEEQH